MRASDQILPTKKSKKPFIRNRGYGFLEASQLVINWLVFSSF